MFQKILSSIGFGCCKVNTVLSHNSIEVGKPLQGEIHIIGGKVEQHIRSINLVLYTEFSKESVDSEFTYLRKNLVESIVAKDVDIEPNKKIIIPFEITIPLFCPISAPSQSLFLDTDLSIHKAIDVHDKDPIIITNQKIDNVISSYIKKGYQQASESGKATIELNDKGKSYLQRFILEKENVNPINIDIYLTDKPL